MNPDNWFYFVFSLDKSVLFVVIRLLSLSHRSLQPEDVGRRLVSVNHIGNAIILGSITNFFMLPIVIWHNNTTELGVFLHETFVVAYFLAAMTQNYSSE